jgi:fucose permease
MSKHSFPGCDGDIDCSSHSFVFLNSISHSRSITAKKSSKKEYVLINEAIVDNPFHFSTSGFSDQKPPLLSLDEAIEELSTPSIGFFHYSLLLLCGLAFMADALEVNLLSFLSTCAGNEWSLSNTEKASITGIVFCGMITGSQIWGVVSDVYGRRVGFLLATLLVTIGGLLTAFAKSFSFLLFARAIVGLGIGGTHVPFDLLAEFMPSKERGTFLVSIQYFWAIGSIMVTLFAWLLLDKHGWRILALITIIPVT